VWGDLRAELLDHRTPLRLAPILRFRRRRV
jgi:hypothetical protein